MEIRSELKYTKDHEWLLIDGDLVTLGITDYAQHQLGEIVYVGLPEVGTILDGEDSVGTIESVKSVSELYCPLSGEVEEVNKDLEESPEMVNESPYDEAWIIKIRIDPSELNGAALLTDEEYAELIKE